MRALLTSKPSTLGNDGNTKPTDDLGRTDDDSYIFEIVIGVLSCALMVIVFALVYCIKRRKISRNKSSESIENGSITNSEDKRKIQEKSGNNNKTIVIVTLNFLI